MTLQADLRTFAEHLQKMAYGTVTPDELSPNAMSTAELATDFADMEFGIPIDSNAAAETVDINRDEAEEVHARRKNCGINDSSNQNAVGLALSGGGIRSGTFSLGVVQVLAAKKLLTHIDFLSTVSGGGYVGSFLTERLGNGATQAEVAAPLGPDPEPVRYLRQNAKFLAARSLKQSWSMVTATLAGMVLNWSAPLLVIALVAFLVTVGLKGPSSKANEWSIVMLTTAASALICLITYGAFLRTRMRLAHKVGAILASILALLVLGGFSWGVTIGYEKLFSAPPAWKSSGTVVALLTALVTAAPAIIRFVPVLKNPRARRIVLTILLWIAGLIVPVIAIIVFYAFCRVASHPFSFLPDIAPSPNGWIVLLVFIAILFTTAMFLNINLTSPHRLYRNGLARTFVRQAENAPNSPLNEINKTQTAPYHILNAALNVPNTMNPAVRDRRCDFFSFSKHWTGAPSTRYFKTELWDANDQPLDLATAMAISGAAFSSYMGLGSIPTLTALLTFLNVRLGFWIRRPDSHFPGRHPGFSCLLREMLSVGMSEKRKWLNLSDGGHIENMALYELLRRRCKFIICVDGEADPKFTFVGLMTLVRHAQIDFGVRIEPRLDTLRTDLATGVTQTHYQFCRIYYPAAGGKPAGIGLLLYLKLSITGNETEVIKRYRVTHPEFPHQSTLDQFFDQEQFEAYRELGVHVAQGVFSPTLLQGSTDPTSVSDWFRRLAQSLLVPIGA